MLDRLIIDRRNYKDGRPLDEQIMMLKFLKVYRNKDNFQYKSKTLYSLNEILPKSQNFFRDKVFLLNIKP